MIAAGLASITAHKAITSSFSLEKAKRQYEAKHDIENIVSMMMNIQMTAKYFANLFSEEFIQAWNANPGSINVIALGIFKELKNNANTELKNLWQVKVSKEISEKQREELRVAIFQIRERLTKIKIHTGVAIEMNTVRKDDFVLLNTLLKEIIDYTTIPSVKKECESLK